MMPDLSVSHLKWLLIVKADTYVAIVEAVELAHLSVRVPADKVDIVRDVLHAEWPIVYKIDVSALGYVEPFVHDVHVFA